MNQDESKTVSTITNQMKELISIKEGFKEDQLLFVKNLINKDLSDNELYMFLVFAGKLGLNPFTREIIAVVYKKDDPQNRKVNYIVTRDGKRRKASDFGGAESIVTRAIYTKQVPSVMPENDAKTMKDMVTIEVRPWEGGTLWGASCTIVRNKKEYTVEVPLVEYAAGEYLWKQKPSTMIKKVAESQALSEAFPELLGVYDESEMTAGSIQGTPSVPQLPDGADVLKEGDPMLETLKVLKANMDREWTKQEATEEIARLQTEKSKGKAKA